MLARHQLSRSFFCLRVKLGAVVRGQMKQYIVYKHGVPQTHDISWQHAAKNLDNRRYRDREELKDDKKPAIREEKNFLSNENDTPTSGQP